MRAFPVTAGRGAVACAAAAPVPRRSLLLSTAAAGATLHSDSLRLVNRSASGIRAQAATFSGKDEAIAWSKSDNRRLLHVVYRVGDLDRTIKFYTECLGMKLLRRRDIPEEKYSNAFLGYGPEDSHFVVELTYNYGVDRYDVGTGFGHFGIGVDDVARTVELVRAKGGKVTREPGPVKGGKTVIAFVEDPDGYKFEILERPGTPEPLCQVMLRVGDLDRAISFYEKIAIGTDDVYKTAEVAKLFGGQVVREPGPLPGINTKITSILDPDGWKSVFVDNIDFAKELE